MHFVLHFWGVLFYIFVAFHLEKLGCTNKSAHEKCVVYTKSATKKCHIFTFYTVISIFQRSLLLHAGERMYILK